MRTRRTPHTIIGAMLALVMAIGLSGPTPRAEAGFAIGFPNFFPPFMDTGTIREIPDLDGGPSCTVFQADSNGAMYFFTGVDSFDAGDRLFVSGQSCTICLTTLTCGLPVSPLLNVKVREL